MSAFPEASVTAVIERKSVVPSGVAKYQGVQALRVVAAVLVILLHATFYTRERLVHTTTLWAPGLGGVDIFFVVSGFVMIMSSERLLARPDGWKIFAERRLVRVVPLYWLLTTVKVLLTAFTAGYTMYTVLTPKTIVCSYLFLPAPNAYGDLEPIMGVGWTLNFEMFFYLLFTVALLLKQNVYRFVGVLLALLAAGAYIRKPGWPAARFYLDTIVLEFFVGMCIAWLCQRRRTLSSVWGVVAILVGLIGLDTWPLLHVDGPRILMIGIPAGLVVYGTASLEPRLRRIPRFVLFLAEASYATYLVHPMASPLGPVLCAKLHISSAALSVSLALLLGLLAGVLVYSFLDLPLSAFFKRHVTNRGKPVVHTPPVIPEASS